MPDKLRKNISVFTLVLLVFQNCTQIQSNFSVKEILTQDNGVVFEDHHGSARLPNINTLQKGRSRSFKTKEGHRIRLSSLEKNLQAYIEYNLPGGYNCGRLVPLIAPNISLLKYVQTTSFANQSYGNLFHIIHTPNKEVVVLLAKLELMGGWSWGVFFGCVGSAVAAICFPPATVGIGIGLAWSAGCSAVASAVGCLIDYLICDSEAEQIKAKKEEERREKERKIARECSEINSTISECNSANTSAISEAKKILNEVSYTDITSTLSKLNIYRFSISNSVEKMGQWYSRCMNENNAIASNGKAQSQNALQELDGIIAEAKQKARDQAMEVFERCKQALNQIKTEASELDYTNLTGALAAGNDLYAEATNLENRVKDSINFFENHIREPALFGEDIPVVSSMANACRDYKAKFDILREVTDLGSSSTNHQVTLSSLKNAKTDQERLECCFTAIMETNIALLKFAIEWMGISVNLQDQKYSKTLLHEAVKFNKKEIISYLLSKGVNSSTKNKYDKTPLDIAMQNGNTDIINMLRK